MSSKAFVWIAGILSLSALGLAVTVAFLALRVVHPPEPPPPPPEPAVVRVPEPENAEPPLRPAPPFPSAVRPWVTMHPIVPAPGHWPQYRGLNRDNRSEETGLLKTWCDDGPPLLWQVEVIGNGRGSIAVAGGLIFVLGYRDGLEFLTALDGEGRIAWSAPVGAAVNEVNHMRWLSQRTPTVDDDRVYVVTARGVLLCLDSANGDLLWQRDYASDFDGKPGAWRGYCDFPLADGPVVICTPGGSTSTVVALDRRTGRTVWSCGVPGNTGGTEAALMACTICGIRQYVTRLSSSFVGVSADSGRLLWSKPAFSSGGGVQNVIRWSDTSLVLMDGWGRTIERLEFRRSESMLAFDAVYSVTVDMNPWFANELLGGNRLYGFSMGNKTWSLSLADGSNYTRSEIAGRFNSSTFADGLFYLHGWQGELAIAKPNECRVNLLRQVEAPRGGREETGIFPVVAGGRLYLRHQNRLLCYDLRTSGFKESPPVWPIASRVRPRKPGAAVPNLSPPKGEPDAIFVPTPMDVVQKMLDLAGVGKEDRVVDLGSGDGRILIAASSTVGCRSVGYEVDPVLVRESRARIRSRGLGALAIVEEKDLFQADLSPFSVVTLYLGEENNSRLLPKLRTLKPGSRIVSHAHLLGAPEVTPDKTITISSGEDGAEHTIYLWTTPLRGR